MEQSCCWVSAGRIELKEILQFFYYFGADVLEQDAVAVPVHGLALTPELI